MRLAYLHQAIKTPLLRWKTVILWILPDAYSIGVLWVWQTWRLLGTKSMDTGIVCKHRAGKLAQLAQVSPDLIVHWLNWSINPFSLQNIFMFNIRIPLFCFVLGGFLFVCFWAVSHDMWDLSSLTRDRTSAPLLEEQSLFFFFFLVLYNSCFIIFTILSVNWYTAGYFFILISLFRHKSYIKSITYK